MCHSRQEEKEEKRFAPPYSVLASPLSARVGAANPRSPHQTFSGLAASAANPAKAQTRAEEAHDRARRAFAAAARTSVKSTAASRGASKASASQSSIAAAAAANGARPFTPRTRQSSLVAVSRVKGNTTVPAARAAVPVKDVNALASSQRMKAKGPGVGRSVSADENSAKRTKATVERERDERIKAKAMIRKVEGLADGKYGYEQNPRHLTKDRQEIQEMA